MEEMEHTVYLMLRSLFSAWASHAPQGVPQKVWFYAWTVLLFSFGLFVIGGFFELLRQLSANPEIAKVILSKVKTRLTTSIEPLRVVVPEYLRVPLLICIVALSSGSRKLAVRFLHPSKSRCVFYLCNRIYGDSRAATPRMVWSVSACCASL